MLAAPSYPKVVGKHKRINGLEYCLQSTQIKTSAFIRVHRRTTKYNSALMKSSTQLLLVEVGYDRANSDFRIGLMLCL